VVCAQNQALSRIRRIESHAILECFEQIVWIHAPSTAYAGFAAHHLQPDYHNGSSALEPL
jgi:hypothetical protein